MQITSVLFTDNGTNLLSCSADKKIIIWDFVNVKKQASIDFFEEVEGLTYIKLNKS